MPRKKKPQDVQNTPATGKTQADYIHESVTGDAKASRRRRHCPTSHMTHRPRPNLRPRKTKRL